MKEVNIKGKVFTEVEICDYGKKSIAKARKILIIIGISLVAVCVIFTCIILPLALTGNMVDSETGESITIDEMLSMLPSGIIYGISGAVLIVLSFVKAKKDPYAAGIAFLNKHFPYPVGFDGNTIDSLKGDKIIELSKSPVSKLIILSSERKFQVVQGNKYSKIFTGQDILEYEIRVDNEVVITSKTKSKKGVGKALVGGALFGGAGMIAGAVAGNGKSKTSQSQKEIHHYMLVLKVNDIINPSFVIELPSLQTAEEVAATLAIICQFESKIEENDELESDKNNSHLDRFDEIKKYKELLDVGIITQEEFENKKKNLLE
jgi:hypothetical protein